MRLIVLLLLLLTVAFPERAHASVELVGFSAAASGSSIRINWQTESELDHSHFNVYRTTNSSSTFGNVGDKTRVNSAPIQASGGVTGGRYEVVDSDVDNETTYYYWLESVDRSGGVEYIGPRSARINTGTGGLGQPTEEATPTITASATSSSNDAPTATAQRATAAAPDVATATATTIATAPPAPDTATPTATVTRRVVITVEATQPPEQQNIQPLPSPTATIELPAQQEANEAAPQAPTVAAADSSEVTLIEPAAEREVPATVVESAQGVEQAADANVQVAPATQAVALAVEPGADPVLEPAAVVGENVSPATNDSRPLPAPEQQSQDNTLLLLLALGGAALAVCGAAAALLLWRSQR